MGIKHRPSFAVELTISIGVVLLPFLIFLHLLFSSESQVLNIFGVNYIHGMPSNELFVWMVFLKLTPILLLSIWYVSTDYAWKYFILIPIIVFSDSLVRYTMINYEPFSARTILISIIANLALILILKGLNFLFLKRFYRKEERVTLLNILKNDSADYYREISQLINKNKTNSNSKIDNNYKNSLFYTRDLIYNRLESKLSLDSDINVLQRNIIVVLLLITPVLHNLHRFIPSETTEIDLGIVQIGSFGFSDVNTAIWLLTIQLTYLLPLALWFITCIHWWRYAILVPIILTLYQIWELLFYRDDLFEYSNLRMIPYILIILSLLALISVKIKYEIKISNLYDKINKELEEILMLISENSVIAKAKSELAAIRKLSDSQKSASIEDLIKLRDEIISELRQKDGE